ncbi:nicotinate-nucleotide adenylyltransferase [Chloroflexota bacterium]
MKIGVLGGTFDPIHNAHLVVAEETRARLDLAEVLFVPAGQPCLKEDRPILAAEHRLQMVRLAIADQSCFKLSTIEIDRTGPSYTVDTMTELQSQLGVGDELYFILGWDNLAQLSRWKEPSCLIKMCHLVAVPRPGYALPDLTYLEGVVPGLSQRLILLDKPNIDMDATTIRNRVAGGLSIRHLVPDPVDKYIRRHKLYLSGD